MIYRIDEVLVTFVLLFAMKAGDPAIKYCNDTLQVAYF